MVVAAAMRQNHIGLKVAYNANDLFAHGKARLKFAVIDIQYLILLHSEKPSRVLRLLVAPGRQGGATLGQMPAVAIGHGDKFDLVPSLRQLDGAAAKTQIGVIRMRSNHQKTTRRNRHDCSY